jgi:hypothetical protein
MHLTQVHLTPLFLTRKLGSAVDNALLLAEFPQHVDEVVGKSVEVDVEFALLDIVAHPALLGLVVVDHLNNLKQVVLVELLKTIGELIHVNTTLAIALLLLLNGASTNLRTTLLAGSVTVDVARNGTRKAEHVVKLGARLGVLENQDVLDLILGLLEVEVVDDGVALAREVGHDDLHLEFTPAVLSDTEWLLLDDYEMSVRQVKLGECIFSIPCLALAPNDSWSI